MKTELFNWGNETVEQRKIREQYELELLMEQVLAKKARSNAISVAGSGRTFPNKYSIEFDGIDEWVNTGFTATLQECTFSFWANPDSSNWGPTSRRPVLMFSIAQSIWAAYQFYGATSVIHLANNNYKYFSDISSYTDGNWHNWVIYLKGSAKTDIHDAQIWVDGTELNPGGGGHAGVDTATWTGNIGLSYAHGSAYGPIDFNMDEFAYFDSDQRAALTTSAYYSAPTDLSKLDPVLWYRMGDEATWTGSQWSLPNQGSASVTALTENVGESSRKENVPK